MDEKIKCKIVEDLLPNYIEKLTSKETNEFIENHIKECDSCKNILDNMKKDVKVEEKKENKKQVNYIKKYNKKLKVLKGIAFIVLAIVAILLIHTFRNLIIIKGLSNKANSMKNIINYYAKTESNQGVTTELYFKDNVYLLTLEDNTPNGIRKLIRYKKDGVSNTYIETETEEGLKKVAILNSPEMPTVQGLSNWFEGDSFGELFIMSFFSIIRKNDLNEKECYNIYYLTSPSILYDESDRFEVYLEKDTGLLLRQQNGKMMDENGVYKPIITNYEYKYNIVKDDDLKEPDINEYEITNN